MAISTIKPIHAGIDIPYNLPIASESWTASNDKYIHTYTDNRITQGCRIEVTFKGGTFNTELYYIEFEKNIGSIDFIASTIPTVVVPLVIHIINAQTGNTLATTATEIETSGDAETLGADVNSSLIKLNTKTISNAASIAAATNKLTGHNLAKVSGTFSGNKNLSKYYKVSGSGFIFITAVTTCSSNDDTGTTIATIYSCDTEKANSVQLSRAANRLTASSTQQDSASTTYIRYVSNNECFRIYHSCTKTGTNSWWHIITTMGCTVAAF